MFFNIVLSYTGIVNIVQMVWCKLTACLIRYHEQADACLFFVYIYLFARH